MRTITEKIAVAVLALVLSSCASGYDGMKDTSGMGACQAASVNNIVLWEQGCLDEESAKKYRDKYGLEVPGSVHRMGILKTCAGDTMVQTYTPERVVGTVLLVHGYLDHSANWRRMLVPLTEHHFRLVLFDMPGHGMSSGAQASIDDFSEYRELLSVMLDFAGALSPDVPIHLLSHSMGAGIAADLLLHEPERCMELSRIVLVAPLLHCTHWKASEIGVGIVGLFKDSIGRTFKANSADPEYLKAQKSDPLQSRTIPFAWVRALRRWAAYMEQSQTRSERELLIIQGGRDNVVESSYNIPFYRAHFPRATVIYIKDGRHQLMNETEGIREPFIKTLIDYLEQKQAQER